MDYKQTEGERQTDTSENPTDGFLVGEETEDVDASGVNDNSTGKKDDYLGKTNKEDED
ncbi:hypothetical protein [Spirosoma rhododendri]|uniref:Uncharacterized protein n=1 Tax=Spirosoma rhododendri TaxID=2728024 RepID=A0A7L5DNG6_9BACT|nr:hypothetical protein [Spirosoma rhododendri]QJD79946.1 hypothetical protein HH216_17150 [Spirosoma rhododendri]